MAALRAGLARRAPTAGRTGALRTGFHLEPGMRVGLFGGSFNPAHEGHAHVAETALLRLGLDRVIWLVSPQNPLKSAGVAKVDYKDVNVLRKFISDRGKIRARRVTGVSVQQQREIAKAVKNAREMALLPYSSSAR